MRLQQTSSKEIQASQLMRRRRTRPVTAAEVACAKWVDIEAHIKFPIFRPSTDNSPQKPIVEEPKIEGILYENGLLKKEVQFL